MIKNKSKNMFMFFIFCSLIVSTVFIDSVYAAPTYNGNTASQAYAASGSCSGTFSSNLFCQYNNDNHVTIKISLYYFKNGSRTKIGNSIYYTNRTDLLDDNYINVGRNSVLESADNKDKNLYTFKSMGLNDITNLTGLAQTLENKFIDASTKYAALDTILIQMGTSRSTLTSPSQPLNTKTPAKYGYRLIIEPVATMVDSSGNQYALTIKQMASTSYGRKVVNSKHWGDSDGRQFAAWAVTQYTDVGITAYTSSTCLSKSKTDAGFNSHIKNLNSGCGYNIIDITYATPQISCDINVNNNEDSKYNWTYWDANCDLDSDGVKEGCWKKQEGGCCDKETLTDDILNKYPQCASCPANSILDLGDDETTDIGRIECGTSNRIITNYRGSGDLDTATSNYCLANNNLYMGTINGKRYGCEIKDQLILPSKYTKKVAIGSYFVWPTSKTLQTLGNFSMQYPLNRVSSLWCVAYKYNTTGQLEYTTLTSAELNTLKARFNPTGNLSLLYEDNNNGNLVKEASSSITSASSDNSNFRIEIKNTYTLQKVSGTSGSYAYYDQENLTYTNTIVNNRINKYVQYGYPVIPFGKKGEKRVSITYGINFDHIDFSKLTSFSGSYICDKSEKKGTPSLSCECESGTIHEGLDLTTYFSATYDSWAAECSRLRDLKCNDPNTDLVCPNDNTKVMNDCVNKKTYGGSTKEEAYNLCVANECNIDDEYDPPTCTGSDCKLDIIYRTIFLNDPFPGINYTDRLAGANWGGSKSLDRDGLGTKYITQTAEQMYQGDPMYSITLTPKAIKEIRDYNQDNGYDNFELSCGDNQYCTSTVLHNTFGKYLTGGTCQLQTNAKKRGNDGKGQDCRITALER